MTVEYVLPLERAVTRMKTMLFKPFRLETWLTLGFASFLAALPQMFGQWMGNGVRFTIQGRGESPGEILDGVRSFLTDPFWLLAGAVVLVLLVTISTLFLWIGCRSRLVFLEDVVRERVAIADPWRRHARLGDSLFLWIVTYGIVALVVWGLFLVPLFVVVLGAATSGFGPATIPAFVLFGLVAAALLVIGAYVWFFLENFVVPIMYRDALTATRAWGRFLHLLRPHFWRFLLCGLWVFVLWIAVWISLLIAGCVTCCCGFLLMVIPYVGSVLLLPISVAYRAFGPEFLAQFGPEWSVFPPPAGTAAHTTEPSREDPLEPLSPPAI